MDNLKVYDKVYFLHRNKVTRGIVTKTTYEATCKLDRYNLERKVKEVTHTYSIYVDEQDHVNVEASLVFTTKEALIKSL